MRTASIKHLKESTPVLDMDLEAGDTYLAELARRAAISNYDESQRDAVLHWIN